MWELDPNMLQAFFIAAAFAEAIALAVTVLVLYKNFTTIKSQNNKMFKRFEFQSNIEKYNLTLKFADWVKTELSDYIPYVIGDTKHEYLTKPEIKEHFDNIAFNMIKLIKEETVFKSLMLDEIKKMSATLEAIDGHDVYIEQLRLLLKHEKNH